MAFQQLFSCNRFGFANANGLQFHHFIEIRVLLNVRLDVRTFLGFLAFWK
jgi:hypothetical protein